MDVLSLLISLVQSLANVPVVGKVLSIIVMVALLAGPCVTALVALWHSLVGVMAALGAIPGLSGLQSLAAKLKAEDGVVDDWANNKLLPILNRISAIPLPQKPAAPTAPPAQ
jgi:vacuolar-type H+-ATPase subunit I/STV1